MQGRTVAQTTAAASAAGLLFLLLWPARSAGWSHLGGALRLTQRDVRVHNNFTDPESNDNQQLDPSFPGATGATLAVWKAVVEWGSEAHGNGLGDATQSILGSGNANFDFSWQGLSPSIGGTDDNTVSQIGGSNGGVYAFTELPISDGWRIRFYENSATWDDGPGDVAGGNGRHDLQGVCAHELGHALGLGHSGDLDATMISFLTGSTSGVHFRSIEADDVAGLQALYGARGQEKAHVSTYEISGAQLTVRGSYFSPEANEVWFTRAAYVPDGTPLEVGGLPSTDQGTRIDLTLPDGVTKGDILVKRPGNGGVSLSNAFPFDPASSPCPDPHVYGTAKTTSLGALPAITYQGRPSLSINDFQIATAGGVPDQNGILLSSAFPAATPFFGGTLWLAAPLRREQRFQFDFLGGATVFLPVTPSLVGTTRYYQLWFADPGDSQGVGLSDAISVPYCP